MKSKTNKCRKLPITITPEVRDKIEAFKTRLLQMAAQPDETSAFDAKTIDLIMNHLDDSERNLLLAYYSIAECSPGKLSTYIGIGASVISHRLKNIKLKLIKLNDTPKTTLNMPRVHIDY